MEKGKQIVNINKMIDGREFDIVTTTELIECKNYYWSHYIDKPEAINKLKSDLGNKLDIAINNGKKFAIHSKSNLPKEFDNLKLWLKKKGIMLYEG